VSEPDTRAVIEILKRVEAKLDEVAVSTRKIRNTGRRRLVRGALPRTAVHARDTGVYGLRAGASGHAGAARGAGRRTGQGPGTSDGRRAARQ
jgi:hypothetical protein